MDKSWMHCSKMAKEYEDRVETFMTFAITNAEGSSIIRCLCTKCMNLSFRTHKWNASYATQEGGELGF